jgi:hypothetical protein
VGSSENLYPPIASVVVVCVWFVAELTSVTVALGTTAPVESVTVPVNPPVVDDWAHKQEIHPPINTIRKARNAKASPFKFVVALMCPCWPGSEEIILLVQEFELFPH